MSKAEDYDEDDDIQVYKVSRDRLAQPEHVHASDISQKRVDETAKHEHEFFCPRCGHCCREWVGLTDGDIAQTMHGSVEGSNMLPYQFAKAIEAKLKEKNT